MVGVKKPTKKRTYDARGRAERARQNREKVLVEARRMFLERGYAKTTLADVASRAAVSVEMLHKVFGGKAGLVRAIYERALEGRGAVPAYTRSDAMSAKEPDGREIVRRWGVLTSEVSPLVSPVLLLVRDAAATDPELAALQRASDEARLERMRHNAEVLATRGFLREGLGLHEATDILWTYSSPELFDLLVRRRGFSPERLGKFVGDALAAALLA